MVQLFLDSGYTELDTAYMYCDGKTEEILGQMECAKGPNVVVATKVNPFGSGGTICSILYFFVSIVSQAVARKSHGR